MNLVVSPLLGLLIVLPGDDMHIYCLNSAAAVNLSNEGFCHVC